MNAIPAREDAIDLDRQDEFANKRDEFELEDDVIYMCGNSLGPMPKKAFSDIEKTMKHDWAKGLVTSHNKAGWFMMTDTLGDRIANLLGADAGEVVLTDGTGLNIYKALHAAISMQPGRNTIVCETDSFPTDLYMIEGVASLLNNMNIKLQGRDAQSMEDLFDENTAVVLLNQVDYRSGEIRDIKDLTEKAHAAGALVVSDVCHSAGAIPVDFHKENVDFAIGCTYKYLNSGPGAPAFIYIAKRHHGKFKQPLTGWFGHAAPFAFELGYRQGKGARAMLTGSQSALAQVAVGSGLDVYEGIDINSLYAKGKKLSALFSDLVDHWCAPLGVGFYGPRDVNKRNGQVSLTHEHGYPIMQAMIERKAIGDFRQPNVMRFGMTPLYLRFTDIWDAANHMKEILETKEWQQDRFNVKNVVT